MKRFIVIETDTEDVWAWVYEVTREFTPEVGDRAIAYRRGPVHSLICEAPNPKFYGKLDALLVTKDKVKQAAPIIPVPPPLTGYTRSEIVNGTGFPKGALFAIVDVPAEPPTPLEIAAETPVERVERVLSAPDLDTFADGSPVEEMPVGMMPDREDGRG